MNNLGHLINSRTVIFTVMTKHENDTYSEHYTYSKMKWSMQGSGFSSMSRLNWSLSII